MNFPATNYELVPCDFQEHKQNTPKLYRTSDKLMGRLVRARTKSELPKGSGLIPQKAACGHFGWQHWILRDDYGRVLAKKQTDN